jgi:diadenosine tetraphosphate (Ap4A) HIT family hydrolase
MIEICKLKLSTVYLFKDQTFKGRCVVAFPEHKRELFELSESDLNVFMNDVAKVAVVLQNLFAPGKINYAIYGDKVSHLHFHIVPKYETGPHWGEPFHLSSSKKILSQTEYDELIQMIKTSLLA